MLVYLGPRPCTIRGHGLGEPDYDISPITNHQCRLLPDVLHGFLHAELHVLVEL